MKETVTTPCHSTAEHLDKHAELEGLRRRPGLAAAAALGVEVSLALQRAIYRRRMFVVAIRR